MLFGTHEKLVTMTDIFEPRRVGQYLIRAEVSDSINDILGSFKSVNNAHSAIWRKDGENKVTLFFMFLRPEETSYNQFLQQLTVLAGNIEILDSISF